MARHHIPDLAALEALPNQEIKFYAIVGAVISLSAALELASVDVYQKSLGIERDLAIRLLYGIRSSSFRRDQANTAMRHRLSSDPKLAEWEKLYERIVVATGGKGTRNLLGHYPVSRHTEGGSAYGFGAYSEGAYGEGPTEKYRVSLSQDLILALNQAPKSKDFASLLGHCRELISLLNDIQDFLDQL
ncbi:MAG: hypothetical protein IIA00_09190 [Proteobacteria bacterium]|nr:hypothetical protein [Pseudomonadota bacterium]